MSGSEQQGGAWMDHLQERPGLPLEYASPEALRTWMAGEHDLPATLAALRRCWLLAARWDAGGHHVAASELRDAILGDL